MDKEKQKVLLVAHNIGALGISSNLKKHQVPIIGISHEEYLVSNLEEKIVLAEKSDFYDEIIRIAKEYKNSTNKKIILLTDADQTMEEVLEHREDNINYIELPCKGFEKEYKAITNKDTLYANTGHIRAPRTYSGDEQYDIIDFPVITKPIESRTGQLKLKGYISNNKEELEKNLNYIEKENSCKAVTQELIEGDTNTLYCVTLYRNEYSHIIVGNVVRKERELPIVNGTGSCHVAVENEKVLEKSIELLNQTNYVGVAMIEFKYSKKYDDYILIEVNGRFPIENNINDKLENDFVYKVYQDMISPKEEHTIDYKSKGKTAYWVFPSYDIRACIKTKVKWKQEYKKHKKMGDFVDAIKSNPDKRVYRAYKKYLLRKVLKKIF